MSQTVQPLVSVVIPVYNGAQFIELAVRSVLVQTYKRFDLTIVNNCSKDRTLEIAQGLAAEDPRIRVHDNSRFLNVVENHNMAFSMVSEEAKYVKILGADDLLFPPCLEELVRVAETYPTVGMVTSYVLNGPRVGFDGLPYPSPFTSGREICRLRLLGSVKVFGGPSSSLIRASIVRARVPFYNPLNYHGDNEAYLELLREHDFGFVHQVLSYNRRGEDSRTTAYLDRVESAPAADLDEITKFGPVYLTPAELRQRQREVTRRYYQFLARNVFEFRGREFWDYHRRHVKALGYPINYVRLAGVASLRLLDMILNPKRTVEGAVRRAAALWRRGRPAVAAPPQPARESAGR